MKELVTLSTHEIHRIQILEQLSKGTLSLMTGAEVLKISHRQAKRLLARYHSEGPSGLAHWHRGQQAHNAYSIETRDSVELFAYDIKGNWKNFLLNSSNR